jgi:hypothetical protein
MLGIVAWLQVLVQETLGGEPHLAFPGSLATGLVMARSSMNFDDSTARSCHANTHTVATPSNSMSRRVPKNAFQSTSSWPAPRRDLRPSSNAVTLDSGSEASCVDA